MRNLWVRTTDICTAIDSAGCLETECDVQNALRAPKNENDLECVSHTDGGESCAKDLASCMPVDAESAVREAAFMDVVEEVAESSSSARADLSNPAEQTTAFSNGIKTNASAGCWRFTSARVTGSSHLQNADGCQDWFSLKRSGTRFVACLSDGAGSAAHGLLGAQIVCNRFTQGVAEIMHELSRENCLEKCKKIVSDIHDDLSEIAACMKCDLSELNSTLVAVIVMDTFCCTLQLGDSFCVVREACSEKYTLAAEPQRGEFANETYFVAGKQFHEKLLIQIRDVPEFITLSSDGLEAIAMMIEEQRPFDPFFSRLESSLRANKITDDNLKEWLRSEDIDKRTTDDRSLLLGCLEK